MAAQNPALQQLRRDQRYYGTYFDFYRRGEAFDPADPQTQARIRARALPRAVIVDAYNVANNQVLRATRAARINAAEVNRVGRPRFNVRQAAANQNPADVAAALTDLQQLDARFGNNLKFVKTLGIGGQSETNYPKLNIYSGASRSHADTGFGIASLWRWTDNNGVSRGRSVVKTLLVNTNNPADTRAQDAMTREKSKTIELARARHIVQRFHVGNFLGQQGQNLDNDPGVLITELARRGDLNALLRTVGRYVFRDRPDRTRRQRRSGFSIEDDDEKVPRSVIWQLFDCLLTACISMAYPPRAQIGPAIASTDAEIGPLMAEQIPAPAAFVNKRDIVHFDLDPQNIFMFDSDANHRQIPVFKVADFGLSHTPNETRDDIPAAGPPYSTAQKSTIWMNRILGKDDWNLPEQFTADWDRVRANQDPFSQNWQTAPISIILDPTTSAGNYSDWSNIWHIGMLMFCCMTVRHPYMPPMAAQDAQIQNIWTYGSEIDQQLYRDFYGDGLCGLVAQCLAVRPCDRPTLQALRTSLDNLKPANVTDNDLAWMRRFMRLPSAPRTTPVAQAFG